LGTCLSSKVGLCINFYFLSKRFVDKYILFVVFNTYYGCLHWVFDKWNIEQCCKMYTCNNSYLYF